MLSCWLGLNDGRMWNNSVSWYITHIFTLLPHSVGRGQGEWRHLYVLSKGTISHFHRHFAQSKCPCFSRILFSPLFKNKVFVFHFLPMHIIFFRHTKTKLFSLPSCQLPSYLSSCCNFPTGNVFFNFQNCLWRWLGQGHEAGRDGKWLFHLCVTINNVPYITSECKLSVIICEWNTEKKAVFEYLHWLEDVQSWALGLPRGYEK